MLLEAWVCSSRALAWIDTEGVAKAQIEVHISDINMLSFPKDKEGSENANGGYKISPKAANKAEADDDIEDDDVPF